jgi:hypothetical protein
MPGADPEFPLQDVETARPGRHRLAALCAVALIVLSCGLLESMSPGTRPVQSVGWVFGPAPAADQF